MTDTDPHTGQPIVAGVASAWKTRPVARRTGPPEQIDSARLARHLGSLALADRWLLLEEGGVPRAAYRFHERPTPRALARLRAMCGGAHPHLIPTDSIIEDGTRHVWIITPYMGDSEGMTNLEQLVARRGGRLPALEVTQAVAHLCTAMSSLRAQKLFHPDLTLDQIVVCHLGRLHVELPGIASILDAPSDEPRSTRERDEITVAQLGAQLLTGKPKATERAVLSHMTRRERRSGVVRWIVDRLG